MIGRLRQFVLGSYPLPFYLTYALTWSFGVTALFAATDPRITDWRPDGGTLVAGLTFTVNLLLMRTIDDIRDLDYDRRYHPDRPLARGAVRIPDLVTLLVTGTILLLALNATRGIAAIALAIQLGYAILLLVIDHRWRWPSGDNLMLGLIVSFPVQLLLNAYLYAGVLHQEGLRPNWHAVVPLVVAATAYLHLEFARKVTRQPRPGERTYVSLFGPTRTAALALVCALVSVLTLLLVTQPWQPTPEASHWGWLALLPLAFPAYGAFRFWHSNTTRWPLLAAALYLLTSFVAYLLIGLLGKGTT